MVNDGVGERQGKVVLVEGAGEGCLEVNVRQACGSWDVLVMASRPQEFKVIGKFLKKFPTTLTVPCQPKSAGFDSVVR